MTDEEVAKHFEQWKETTQRLKIWSGNGDASRYLKPSDRKYL